MFRAAPEGPRGWSEESRESGGEPEVGPGRAPGRIWGSTSQVSGGTLGRDGGVTAGILGAHCGTQGECPGKHW